MIKTLDVKGINHQFNYTLNFYEDMNVLTGRNGSGKTTLLKLLWYLTSGNLHRIIFEIPFTSVKIETTWFDLSMEKTLDDMVKLEWKFTNKSQSKTLVLDLKSSADDLVKVTEQIAEEIARVVLGSLYFPTFRRIEVGQINDQTYNKLKTATLNFSEALSVKPHKFITTVSTGDINRLLIGTHESLKQLQDQQDTSDNKDTLEFRWDVLRNIIEDIYNEYKIEISVDIRFEGGEGKWELRSDDLSSGEKQFLGFLCHNAFSTDQLIFIDEPELSLHIDYQRLILPVLEAQGTDRQFFVATHSPFIYSRYKHKEINLMEQTDESES